MFILNPLAKPFVPMGARLVRCSVRPNPFVPMGARLVRCSARPNPFVLNKVILQTTIVPEDVVVAEEAKGTIVEKEKEKKEEKEWKEERMKSWLDSAITAPPLDIQETWENIHKINRNYCE